MWTYPSWSTPSGPGTSSPWWPAAVGWFMVLRRQTFAGHTCPSSASRARPARSSSASARPSATSPFCVGGGAGHRAPRRRHGGRHGEESARHRHRAGLRAGLRIPVRRALPGLPQRPSTPCCSAASWASPPPRSSVLAVVGAVVLSVLAADRPPAALRLGRPGRGRGPRCAGARPGRRCSCCCSGVATAEASQITGSLLVFALLVVPAATAQRLTARPVLSLLLTVCSRSPRPGSA